MILLSAEIKNFGKLSDIKLSFGEGLNTLLRDNGWGKSTLAGFILAMFYGLPDNKKKGIGENPRKFYLPWSGDTAGGAIEYENQGMRYRLERTFGQKPTSDTHKLYNLTEKKEEKIQGDSIGESLFGIDREGFLLTAFLGEKSTDIKENGQSVKDKVSFTLGDTVESFDIEGILEKIEEERRFLFKTGGRGKIAELTSEISLSKAKLEEYEILRKEYGDLQTELDVLDKEYNKKTDAKNAKNTDVSRDNSRKSEYLRTDGELRLEIQKEGYESERINDLLAFFHGDVPTDEIIRQNEALFVQRKERKDAPESRDNLPLVLIYLTLITGAILAGIFLHPIGYALSLLPLFFLVRMCRFGGAKKRDENAFSSDFLEKYGLCSTDVYGFDVLRKKRYEIEALKTSVEATRRNIEGLKEKLTNFMEVGFDGRDDETEALIALTQRREVVREKLRRVSLTLDAGGEESRRCAELEDQKKKAEDRLFILKKTTEFLTNSSEKLTSKVISPTKEKFDGYMQALGLSELVTSLDRDFSLSVTENAMTHDGEWYSRGTRDLLAFCLRLSLFDVIFDENMPPLFLDDPFSALDKTHLSAVKALIKKLSADRQIIYLSCSEERI